MAILIGASAFFSASEAALFSLKATERRILKTSSHSAARACDVLLRHPERLLSAILFWNLLANISYFTLASLAALRMQEKANISHGVAVGFPLGALLVIIFLSEMLPKSFAVIKAISFCNLVGHPLSIAVRVLDPIMPTLRAVTIISRRVVWPRFRPEPYLEAADLARAIAISTTNKELLEQEQQILHNIVSLSDISVEECMRPRTQLVTYSPPVSLSDIRDDIPNNGYLLITENESDEVALAANLQRLSHLEGEHLEYRTESVLYVPWCITAAEAIQRMKSKERETAIVVNELGETIGAITRDDILDVIFASRTSRSARLLNREPIIEVGVGLWEVVGIANLRVLEDYFHRELPTSRNVTVGGVIQEVLQHIPEAGDVCEWGPFRFEVSEMLADEQILVQTTLRDQGVS
ncbi:MAG: DUF21 domain-containing protein [Planctomycetales bacterium]|nr:DUF21 domain-containing protein [Planctomycetales bacterium]